MFLFTSMAGWLSIKCVRYCSGIEVEVLCAVPREVVNAEWIWKSLQSATGKHLVISRREGVALL